MDDKLLELITASYGAEAARAAADFRPGESEMNDLASYGRYVLQTFPPQPGSCAVMSAMWAAALRDTKKYPVHAVAGILSLDGVPIFGQDTLGRDFSNEFSGENLDWDGHVWIQFGEYIGDISLFRTAYADKAPQRLKAKVVNTFGEGRGLFAMPEPDACSYGLHYDPQYVLSDEQISGLMRGAAQIIQQATGRKWPPSQ